MGGKSVFVDTSGFLALLNRDDEHHAAAKASWVAFGNEGREVWTSDYVRLETCALIQRRLGVEALKDFYDRILVLIRVLPVGEEGFRRAFEIWRLAGRKQLSLVDITSFHLMRGNGTVNALAFDRHFAEQGFQIPRRT
jgi:predicted nucleic acid-binding protein